ncbi:hypothetical protein Tco_0986887 [Tanacetum coccineum]
MACSLPHTDSEVEALVQRLITEDKGHQDVFLNLAFQFEDSCAVRDDLRKAHEKCNDIPQESHALICTLLKECSEKDRKLHLSMSPSYNLPPRTVPKLSLTVFPFHERCQYDLSLSKQSSTLLQLYFKVMKSFASNFEDRTDSDTYVT